MAYEMQHIKYSQQIFYYLLEHKQLREEDNIELYRAYSENEEVLTLVKEQAEAANCMIERYSDTIYLIPNEDNEFLGYSKAQLKQLLCKSAALDRDYYLSQFVILTLLVEFYDGKGSSSKVRDFMKAGELMNCLSERLREGASLSTEEQAACGVAFSDMMQAFEALRSSEQGSRQKTTKEGFLYHILSFLQKQGLIEYIENDEMIKTTPKLDYFMDWNLLNQNNYSRVMKVLGVDKDE